MTYEEYLQKNQDVIEQAKSIMNSKVYKQAVEFMKTPQYRQGFEYLKKVDEEVHKDILQKIDFLQKELLNKIRGWLLMLNQINYFYIILEN